MLALKVPHPFGALSSEQTGMMGHLGVALLLYHHRYSLTPVFYLPQIYFKFRLKQNLSWVFFFLWKSELLDSMEHVGFPDGGSGKEPACQCRRGKRLEFDPWVGKIPWRRKWQPTPVCLPRKFHEETGRLQSMGPQRVGHVTERVSTHGTCTFCW